MMDEDALVKALASCSAEVAVLRSEKAKLKKRVRELEHIRILDQAEIIGLRRQIERLVEYDK